MTERGVAAFWLLWIVTVLLFGAEPDIADAIRCRALEIPLKDCRGTPEG